MRVKDLKTPPQQFKYEESGVARTILPFDLGNGATFLMKDELYLIHNHAEAPIELTLQKAIKDCILQRCATIYHIFRMEVLIYLERFRLLLLKSRVGSDALDKFRLDTDIDQCGLINPDYTALIDSINWSEMAVSKEPTMNAMVFNDGIKELRGDSL